MSRKNYEADWERNKRSIRTVFEDPPALSPIWESVEPTSRGGSSSPKGATVLPELIVEIVPKRPAAVGESALFYRHLRKRMRKYYRKLFNLRADDDDSSGTEFDVAAYDEDNPDYIIVTHHYGSSSSRKDSSEKDRTVASELYSGNGEDRLLEPPGPMEKHDDLMESFIFPIRKNFTTSAKSKLNVDDSEEFNIQHCGPTERFDSSTLIMQEEPFIKTIIPPLMSATVETEEKLRENNVNNLDQPETENVENSIAIAETECRVDSSQRKTNEYCPDVLDKSQGGIGAQDDKSEDSEDKGMEHRYSEEITGSDEMESETVSDQLGDSQEERDEEEEGNSKSESDQAEKRSDQLSNLSKIQDTIEEPDQTQEENSDQTMEEKIEEVEIMRSYNPPPSFDSLRHDPISDAEERSSLNLTEPIFGEIRVSIHSTPKHLAQSIKDVSDTVEIIEVDDDGDEFHPLLRTSLPRQPMETIQKTGMKRSFTPLILEEDIPVTKKRTFRNVSRRTGEIENQETTGNGTNIKNIAVQTGEREVQSKNVGTHNDMISLQEILRNNETQTEENHAQVRSVEIQTEERQPEQIDANTQTDSRHEGVNNIGTQTHEREDDSRQDSSEDFFARLGRVVFIFL